jgi:hypothetical protein
MVTSATWIIRKPQNTCTVLRRSTEPRSARSNLQDPAAFREASQCCVEGCSGLKTCRCWALLLTNRRKDDGNHIILRHTLVTCSYEPKDKNSSCAETYLYPTHYRSSNIVHVTGGVV